MNRFNILKITLPEILGLDWIPNSVVSLVGGPGNVQN
jgi:hypothetical protein